MSSDRIVFAGAAVPMFVGVIALGLLNRASPVRLPEAKAAARTVLVAQKPNTEAGWVGVIMAGYTAELAADAEGRVAQVFAHSGSRVAEGDKLLQFDEADANSSFGMASAELEQRSSELSRALARSQAAKAKLARVKASEQWVSAQEMDTARSESRVADAELRAARAAVGVGKARVSQQQLVVSRRTLVAPFAGVVVGVSVDPGDSVAPGQIVLRVVSEDRQVRFAFPPNAFESAGAREREVAIQLEGTSLSIRAKISAVRPEVDPSSQLVFGSAPLPETLPEAHRWIPGAPVVVTLPPASAAGGTP